MRGYGRLARRHIIFFREIARQRPSALRPSIAISEKHENVEKAANSELHI